MKWFLILYVYNQILDIEYFSKFLQEIFILLILNERYYQIKYYIFNKWITRGLIFKDIKIIKLCSEEWFFIRRVSISPYSVYHTLKNFLKPSTPFISTIPNLLKSLLMLFSSYIYIYVCMSRTSRRNSSICTHNMFIPSIESQVGQLKFLGNRWSNKFSMQFSTCSVEQASSTVVISSRLIELDYCRPPC